MLNIAAGASETVNAAGGRRSAACSGSRSSASTQPTRPGDVEQSSADISLARELIGFEPTDRLRGGPAADDRQPCRRGGTDRDELQLRVARRARRGLRLPQGAEGARRRPPSASTRSSTRRATKASSTTTTSRTSCTSSTPARPASRSTARSATLGPGGLCHVASTTPRKVSNVGEDDLVLLVIGGKDGYVERDGHLVDPEDAARRASFGQGLSAAQGLARPLERLARGLAARRSPCRAPDCQPAPTRGLVAQQEPDHHVDLRVRARACPRPAACRAPA